MNKQLYDLLGVGIGPFNLSLAALLSPLKELNILFCDNKSKLQWHPELMMDNAPMQTSFLKDLVTPIQPTNPYTFMNYLVENDQFYHFLNTSRSSVTRYEFEHYLKWASEKMSDVLEFDSEILDIEHHNNHFRVIKEDGEYFSRNLCIASGPVANIPQSAKPLLSESVFHAKSPQIQSMNLTGKRVLIVGGGQTGVEVFRNILKSKWGSAQSLKLISSRENLQPLDESAFTNEVFSPHFVQNFYTLEQKNKDAFTQKLLLASDGNTPSYLQDLYNELYLDKFYKKEFPHYTIEPMRWFEQITKNSDGSYYTEVKNLLNNNIEKENFDIVIFATGFCSKLPRFMEGLKNDIFFDELGRFKITQDYKLETSFTDSNIYAMNYSRHGHGIADPQTSLMSWRSAVIANSLLGREEFRNTNQSTSFLKYF